VRRCIQSPLPVSHTGDKRRLYAVVKNQPLYSCMHCIVPRSCDIYHMIPAHISRILERRPLVINEKCQFRTVKCQFRTEKCQFRTEKCQFSTERCRSPPPRPTAAPGRPGLPASPCPKPQTAAWRSTRVRLLRDLISQRARLRCRPPDSTPQVLHITHGVSNR
jgi:hypothetical protein